VVRHNASIVGAGVVLLCSLACILAPLVSPTHISVLSMYTRYHHSLTHSVTLLTGEGYPSCLSGLRALTQAGLPVLVVGAAEGRDMIPESGNYK
jgi:hypothetical protein